MAIGDLGAAKGLIIFPATQAHGLGYQNDNQRADDIAREIDARAAADSSLLAHIDNVLAIVQQQAALIAQLRTDVDSKHPLLGYTPVRQTDNNTEIGLRWNGANVVARLDNAVDVVVG
jgi:hypothetical protein